MHRLDLRLPRRHARRRPRSDVSENSGEPDRIRTCDPLIKSQLLYQLSYGPITGRFFMNDALGGQA